MDSLLTLAAKAIAAEVNTHLDQKDEIERLCNEAYPTPSGNPNASLWKKHIVPHLDLWTRAPELKTDRDLYQCMLEQAHRDLNDKRPWQQVLWSAERAGIAWKASYIVPLINKMLAKHFSLLMLDTGEKMMDHNCLLLGGSILRALLLYVRQAHKVTGVVEKHVLENYVDMLDGRLENKHDRPPTLTFAKRFDLDFFLFGLPTEQDLNKVLHQKVELLLKSATSPLIKGWYDLDNLSTAPQPIHMEGTIRHHTTLRRRPKLRLGTGAVTITFQEKPKTPPPLPTAFPPKNRRTEMNAILDSLNDPIHDPIKVTLVTTTSRLQSPVQLLYATDLPCSQLCFDGKTLWGTQAFWNILLRKAPVLFPAGLHTASRSYVNRLLKYSQWGFRIRPLLSVHSKEQHVWSVLARQMWIAELADVPWTTLDYSLDREYEGNSPFDIGTILRHNHGRRPGRSIFMKPVRPTSTTASKKPPTYFIMGENAEQFPPMVMETSATQLAKEEDYEYDENTEGVSWYSTEMLDKLCADSVNTTLAREHCWRQRHNLMHLVKGWNGAAARYGSFDSLLDMAFREELEELKAKPLEEQPRSILAEFKRNPYDEPDPYETLDELISDDMDTTSTNGNTKTTWYSLWDSTKRKKGIPVKYVEFTRKQQSLFVRCTDPLGPEVLLVQILLLSKQFPPRRVRLLLYHVGICNTHAFIRNNEPTIEHVSKIEVESVVGVDLHIPIARSEVWRSVKDKVKRHFEDLMDRLKANGFAL